MATSGVEIPTDIEPVPDIPDDIEVLKGGKADEKPPEKGMLRKAYEFAGGRTGLGALAGYGVGAALAPETGGLSFLIPALLAGGGAATGAATEGKSPLKEGLLEGVFTAATGGLGKLVKPGFQLARQAAVSTFAGRDVASKAAESLLKRWLSPEVSAKALYEAAEATRAMVPYKETARTVNEVLKKEVGRLPLETQAEILQVMKPISRFVSEKTLPAEAAVMAETGVLDKAGKPIMKVVKEAVPERLKPIAERPVADAMAEVRRLGAEAKKAFSGKTPNTELGNAINKLRASLIDDLERAGVPEVRQASKAYRKQMAIEDLAREVARPTPGTKIRDYARKNPLFKGAFDTGEMEQINRVAEKLSHFAPSATAGVIGRLATMGAGAAIGYEEGSPFLGGLAGVLGPEAIRRLLTIPYGRQVTERVLEAEIKPGPRSAAILAQIAKALGQGKLNLMRGEYEE